MITADSFKEPKHIWSISGAGFAVQVSRHVVTIPEEDISRQGPYRWAVYGFVYPSHPLFPKFDPNSYTIYQSSVSEAPLHGGCSFFQKHLGGNGEITSFQFGCDYNHLYDDCYTRFKTKDDALSIFGDACRLHDWLNQYGKDAEVTP